MKVWKILASYNGTTFTYDGLGRRISKGDVSFTYDSDGRLIKQSNELEFVYDNNGMVRRRRRLVISLTFLLKINTKYGIMLYVFFNH